MATTRLTRTSGTPTNNSKWTISVWLKRGNIFASDAFIMDAYVSANDRFKFAFQSADKLEIWNSNGGSDDATLTPNRKFRDTSAWYHLLLSMDATLSTATDRFKLYINGVREADFGTNVNPPQNSTEFVVNQNGATLAIGDYHGGSNNFDGCMSHFHFVDGTAYDPTTFGETDATTGLWKINATPSVTYGNNGFFILKDGNSVTDQSGNSNNFTVAAGTLTNTEDCPSNSFATINSLDGPQDSAVFANGDTTWSTSSASHYFWGRSTIGASSGKYYFEAKLSSASSYNHIGICDRAAEDSTTTLENETYGWAYKNSDGQVYNNGSGTSYGNTFTTGDILGVAMDLDNNRLFFSKNGTWQNSGDPTSSTGAITITAPSSTSTGNYFFVVNDNASGDSVTWQCNFGNGTFGSTAISSEGTNASGIGKFEYDVPAGYTALCTKGLNE
jgi:hypothetical protein